MIAIEVLEIQLRKIIMHSGRWQQENQIDVMMQDVVQALLHCSGLSCIDIRSALT